MPYFERKSVMVSLGKDNDFDYRTQSVTPLLIGNHTIIGLGASIPVTIVSETEVVVHISQISGDASLIDLGTDEEYLPLQKNVTKTRISNISIHPHNGETVLVIRSSDDSRLTIVERSATAPEPD